ncbi:MAG: 5-formyltetrahydrofolate cyclo-ligase [Flavobacteriales bacterium]|nr:5-formyltetrahydrofolate cyclo-ligase [Flavobacteriales bacterium]
MHHHRDRSGDARAQGEGAAQLPADGLGGGPLPLLDRAVAKGIAVYAPKSLKGRVMENYRYTGQQDLVPGVFGTRHPAGDAYTGTFDLIIVPGLAFTAKGHRLGYGAGYYDTFLPQHPEAFTVAVCFPFQVVASLPVEGHDHVVHRVASGGT